MTDNYHLSRKSKLTQEFDKAVDHVRGVLVARYGEQPTYELAREARQEFEALIPQLPYIGGKRPYTQFIISTAWSLVILSRAMARRLTTASTMPNVPSSNFYTSKTRLSLPLISAPLTSFTVRRLGGDWYEP